MDKQRRQSGGTTRYLSSKRCKVRHEQDRIRKHVPGKKPIVKSDYMLGAFTLKRIEATLATADDSRYCLLEALLAETLAPDDERTLIGLVQRRESIERDGQR